jgi:hypothetical protein
MILGGVVEALLGVDAERKSLEQVAAPINAVRTRVGRREPAAAGARAQ